MHWHEAHDDPARYWARRIREETGLEPPLTFDDVVRAIEHRGGIVVLDEHHSCCTVGRYNLLLLRRLCTPGEAAHELCHLVAEENTGNGVDVERADFLLGDPESACERFRAELLGDADA